MEKMGSVEKRDKIVMIYTDERIRSVKPRPPLAFLCMSAAIKSKGYEPVIIDARICDNIKKRILEHINDTILFGVTTIIGDQIRFSLALAEFLKSVAPQIPIVFGGVFPSMAPGITMENPFIDFVICGEGEDSIVELAEAISGGQNYSGIKNLSWKKDGKIVHNEYGPLRDLNDPVMPDWEQINLLDYKEANIYSSKGCASKCSFCYNNVFNRATFRVRKPQLVINEIRYLHTKYGVTKFSFVDDNFFMNLNHAKEMIAAIKELEFDITWETTCRADDFMRFSDDFMNDLEKSGCKELYMGIESGSDKMLKNMQKRIKSEMVFQCCDKAIRYRIRPRLLFMIGIIGETAKDRKLTFKIVDLLRKKYKDKIKIPAFGIYTPYPGIAPNLENIGVEYKEPNTLDVWSRYHHDHCNHYWLSKACRDELENIVGIFRVMTKRKIGIIRIKGIKEKLILIDAIIRWKLRFFRVAPEWNKFRYLHEMEIDHALARFREELGLDK